MVPDPAEMTEQGRPSPSRLLEKNNLPILLGGLVFLLLSVTAFVASMYLFWVSEQVSAALVAGGRGARGIDAYYPELILCAIGVFSAILGVSLLRAAGAASIPPPSPIVSPTEWTTLAPEVKAANEDAITQYVRLRSLAGFTGMFTKLGLQGLPLATIGLTIFFSLMYFQDKAFIDLAKLTLGAFIGSFVQKSVGERQATGGTVRLPTGEKLSVKSAAPPTPA